ncbi:MAG: FAD-dependent oxidoreductase [Armatimonadetes bacterium]|nr:FAD-dependent oxidoreductase [Armatimonadota bacterium]
MSGKILVVDDEQNMRYLLRITLRSEGFKVTTVAGGAEALVGVRAEMPDLVILDILMPDMDGWQVCEELRKMAPEKELPIIVLSAVAPGEQELENIHKYAISDYVVKPFEPMLLCGKIKQVLGLAAFPARDLPPLRKTEHKESRQAGYVLAPPRKTPILGAWDLVVAGGGPAGVAAATAGARNGAKTLLVERYGLPGGMATMGLGSPMVPFHHDGKPLCGGIFLELLDRLVTFGGALYPSPETDFLTSFDPELLSETALEMLEEAGVELLFHSYVFDVHTEGHKIKHLLVCGKSGRFALGAQVFVDATGDGNVSGLAGAPCLPDDRSCEEKLPVLHHIRVGGVDHREAGKLTLADLKAATELALEDKALSAIGIRFHPLPRAGEYVVVSGAAPGHGLSVGNLTRGEVLGRHAAGEMIHFLRKYVPGFDQAYLVRNPIQTQVRETRHVSGAGTVSEADIPGEDGVLWALLPQSEEPPSITADHTGGWLSHNGKPSTLHPIVIPYLSLVPNILENLLVAGRCISASRGASPALLSLGVCMGIGQVAGTAAALSRSSRIAPRNLPIGLLQRVLRNQGMLVPQQGVSALP